MTFQTARDLWERSRSELEGLRAVTIDLANVTEVDSAGLALLLEWVSWARQRGFTLSFANLPDKLRALARLSEVEGLLGLEPRKSGS